MINALRNRTKEAVIKLSNDLNSIDSADRKGNYVKLSMLLDKHAKEIRDISQDINKYKDELK